MDFTFQTVPHIIVQDGAATRLGALLAEHPAFAGLQRPLIVTDQGLIDAGLLQGALASLSAAGLDAVIYSDVIADPPDTLIKAAATIAREEAVDAVIGLGGGSSMDTAKLIAVLAKSDQPLEAMYGVGFVTGPRLPLAQVPTTAGTGSEVTPISIVTTGETTKSGIVSPVLYADLAILDAPLTARLPSAVTAATGVDAMVHAIEAYTSKIRKNPYSDHLAREALRLLSQNLLPACGEGAPIEARRAMLMGSMLAGQAFANAPVAAVHALAYPLGGIYHLPHGLTNSLVLPHVLQFNASAAAALYAELAPIVKPGAAGSVATLTDIFVEELTRLTAQAGIPKHLSEVGVSHNALPRLD
ncbi:MAG: iron-containing alcohol dehydrogenase, partial [Pseudomonadota bacterium]